MSIRFDLKTECNRASIEICMSNVDQGQLGSIFSSHNHLNLKAHPSLIKLKIVKPPSYMGL
jgi:hypothetical protein